MARRFPVALVFCLAFVMMAFTTQTAHAQNSLFWDASGEFHGVMMEATYSELYFGDVANQELEVRVWNAPPNRRLKIFILGTPIGVLQTNADGIGLFFKGRIAVPLGNDGRPTSPRIEDGDLIEVGNRKANRFIIGNFMPR